MLRAAAAASFFSLALFEPATNFVASRLLSAAGRMETTFHSTRKGDADAAAAAVIFVVKILGLLTTSTCTLLSPLPKPIANFSFLTTAIRLCAGNFTTAAARFGSKKLFVNFVETPVVCKTVFETFESAFTDVLVTFFAPVSANLETKPPTRKIFCAVDGNRPRISPQSVQLFSPRRFRSLPLLFLLCCYCVFYY